MTPAPKRARNPQTGEVVILQGGQWVPEPKAPPQAAGGGMTDMGGQQPQAPAPRVQDHRVAEAPGSFGDNITKTAADAGRNLYEGARGVGSALMLGFDDEVATALGADPNDKREGQQFSADQSNLAGRFMPSANTMGQVTGSLIGAKGMAAAGTAAGGGRVVGAATSMPAQGALQGAGDAEAGGRLEGAAKGAAIGAALGGGAKLVGKGLSAVGKTYPGLARLADKARVNAAGIPPRAADALPGGIPETAATIRQHGIGKGLAGANKMEMQAAQAIDGVEASREGLRAPARAANDMVTGDTVARPLRKAADVLEPANAARADYLRKRAGEFSVQKLKSARMAQPAPGGDATRPAGAPAPRMRMEPTEIEAPRLYDVDQLRAARAENAPQNWGSDAQGAESAKAIQQAFSDAEGGMIGRHTPGGEQAYRKLGREEAALIEARKGLLGADPGRLPAGKFDALREAVKGGRMANMYATGVEGTAGMAGKAARAGAKVSQIAGSPTAQQGGSLLTRRATNAIEEAEYPEDEYYRQYMSNPDFRHSGQ